MAYVRQIVRRTAAFGLFALLAAFSFSAPARAEWLRAESPNFIVYGEGTSARLRARITLLEEFDRLLRALTGTTAPPTTNKLTVYLVRGTREMQRIAPVGWGVGGFYRASPDATMAVADENENRGPFQDDTLLHEYAHHFMLQYHPAPYPLWYVEGFADYVMTAAFSDERIEYGNFNLARASWLGDRQGWIRYEDLLFGDSRRLNAGRFYAQSWLLVHYILRDESRRAALIDYIQALARGEAARPAFVEAFGLEPAELDRLLPAYARRITFHRLAREGPASLPPISITRPEGVSIDIPVIEAALNWGVPADQRRSVLRWARRVGHDSDAYGKRVRARAELVLGDPAVAERILDELLAASPQDVELLYLKGLRHLVAGRRQPAERATQFRRAKEFFARAHRLNPDHYQTLYRYAEALSGTDELVTENGRNILLLASQLAPQVNEIRLAAGHLLLLREEFELARTLLLPIAASAHREADAARARALIDLAEARQRPAQTDIFADPAERRGPSLTCRFASRRGGRS